MVGVALLRVSSVVSTHDSSPPLSSSPTDAHCRQATTSPRDEEEEGCRTASQEEGVARYFFAPVAAHT